MLHHEVGSNTGGRPGPSHDTVYHHQATTAYSLVYEGGGGVEISEE